MQTVHLAYGRSGLAVQVPDHAEVIEPRYLAGLADEGAALVAALRDPISSRPLRELARPGCTAAIVHTDITRATPNDRILPPLIAELESAGVRPQDITLLNALGTHRPQTPSELEAMLGRDIIARYRCLQHDAGDAASLAPLGRTRFGHEVRINRHFLEADLRILTGFIEPHFFAGFSGGPKGVLPSIAGAESVLDNHGADMIAHPQATWGITHGNPIWEEMLEAAGLARPSFILNVALNRHRQITGVFAGDLAEAHARGCDFVRRCAMVPVSEPYDVVMTSNSGYPLDMNLYQAVKGMSAAAQVVRPGGCIIIAAECSEGIPEHGHFGRLLQEFASPEQALERIQSPGFACSDQWQVQILARVLLKSRVYVHAGGLWDDQIRECLLLPCRSVENTLAQITRHAAPARIGVLPEGPLTIPYLDPARAAPGR